MTTENGSTTVMPVQPMYGGYGNNGGFGFGGDASWLIVLFLFAMMGGWGNGGFGGFGGGMGYDFPWLLNGQNAINANTNSGFDHAATQSAINGLQTSVVSGFGYVQNALCSGFAGVNASISNGFAQAEIGENARQMSNMQQMFGIQSALQNCCCENRASVADLKYTVATEACADRAAVSNGIRDVLTALTAGVQSIKDDLCAERISRKDDEIAQLRQEVLFARGQSSQDVQTAAIRAGQATTANQLVNELRSCPIPSMPVYGQTPIFSCNNNGCGCGCGNGSF